MICIAQCTLRYYTSSLLIPAIHFIITVGGTHALSTQYSLEPEPKQRQPNMNGKVCYPFMTANSGRHMVSPLRTISSRGEMSLSHFKRSSSQSWWNGSRPNCMLCNNPSLIVGHRWRSVLWMFRCLFALWLAGLFRRIR